MGKQKVRWKQSTKSGYSAKRAYHKEWRKWQKAVGEAKRLAMPIPQLSDFVDKSDYTVPRKKARSGASPA